MNKAVLLGRLTRDVTMRYTNSGKAVASFTLAVDKYTKEEGKKSADFIPIIAWGALGEACGQYLSKGRQALVEGCIQTRSYEDKSGNKKYITEVVAVHVEFVGGKAKDSGNSFGEDSEEVIPF